MTRILFAAILSVAAAGAAGAADLPNPPPVEAPGEYVPLCRRSTIGAVSTSVSMEGGGGETLDGQRQQLSHCRRFRAR